MRIRLYLTLGLLLCATAPAYAVIGVIDNVPGATLLFPHFEVDVQNEAGINTLVSIQNTSASAALANVTLWTDYGLPTTSFPIYLTGYDTEAISMRSLFQRILPTTGSAGQDFSDTVSPKGIFSQDINFASCNGTLPGIGTNGLLVSEQLAQAHTGEPSVDYFAGNCGAFHYGDNIARGYITVDSVTQCTTLRPGSPGYFAGPADLRNILVGDWVIQDPNRKRLLADNAVAIEASTTNPLTSTVGAGVKHTFYARFVNYLANDNREPLPTAWAGFDSQGRTAVAYWRDPGVAVAPFACGGAPSPFPLNDRLVTAFDADGATVTVPAGDHFPLASGITPDSALGATSNFGWLFTNLNLSAPNGPLGTIRQSWVNYRQKPRGVAANSNLGFAVPGTQLGNASAADDPILP